jgi:hypothetical protein
MTTIHNRTATALLIIDVQVGVVSAAHQRDAVIANIQTLLNAARASSTPVIWVQHSDEQMPVGSAAWQYVPELVQLESEPLVHKLYGDSFEGTNLGEVLAAAKVGQLVVVGAQTDACIRSTIHGAFTRGYDVTLVSDATPPKTRLSGVRHPPTSSLNTPTCIGSFSRRQGEWRRCYRPPRFRLALPNRRRGAEGYGRFSSPTARLAA